MERLIVIHSITTSLLNSRRVILIDLTLYIVMNITKLLNISTFINILKNQSNLYTELVSTTHIEKAVYLAETIYLDLPKNSLVKKVIDEVTNKPVKVTGSLDIDGKLKSDKNSVFNIEFNAFKPNLPKSAGVYLFTNTLLDLQYIGSAMNFNERIQLHRKKVRSSSSKFHKFVSKNSWNDFVFGTVYETTHYLMEFKSRFPTYNLSIGEMIILSHLTQLEARVLEQSLITKFSPKLNSEKEVVFSYTSWNPLTLNKSYDIKTPNAITVEVLLEDTKDILTTYPSINQAAIGLGASTITINRYLNKSYSFESTSLELRVFVQTPNKMIDNSPIVYPKAKQYSLIDYNISSLEEGYIYALDYTKSNCVYKFQDLIIATKTLDPTKTNGKEINQLNVRHISRYLNKDKLIKTELGHFYFICNPNYLTNLRAK